MTLLARIATAAASMRAAQRAYFLDRTPDSLRASKALEAQLDKLLDEHANELAGVHQESLFQEGPQG